METKANGNTKRRFNPFDRLRTWWRRRRFQYLVHVNIPEERIVEECKARAEITNAFAIKDSRSFVVPLSLNLEDEISLGVNSPHDSIETLDSISDTHYIYSKEEISGSGQFVDEFLMEHLNFLSQSTQLQEVQLMYDTN
mmetsp:Transcript_14112/g.32841  ORF Transcript_14112/g.32841 Transcript_14112/m.32841 type:complete len:139 (-) Transcript_14112:2170-2586(-)